METPVSVVESLFEQVETYSKKTFELSKLKSVETAANVATSLLTQMGVIVMISLFVIVLSIGIALLLGELLGKVYYGFFIVAAFYLLAGGVLHYFLYGWIKTPVSNFIIRQTLQ
jgi:uncharacterized membrane protein